MPRRSSRRKSRSTKKKSSVKPKRIVRSSKNLIMFLSFMSLIASPIKAVPKNYTSNIIIVSLVAVLSVYPLALL